MTVDTAFDPPVFARKVFLAACGWGALTMLPLPFLRGAIEAYGPLGHLEYFYGFIGVCLAFQFVFWVVAGDPQRYRPLMLCCVFEKAAFAVPVAVLVSTGKADAALLLFAGVDTLLGALFLFSYFAIGAHDLREKHA
jgi:hypothetical protein